jgi:hypothetical protein
VARAAFLLLKPISQGQGLIPILCNPFPPSVSGAPEISFGFGRWRKIKKQTANKANKTQARANQIGPNAGPRENKSNQIGPPEGEKKDKSNQIPAEANQMKPNTSTDKSNQIEPVHLDVSV